MAGEQRITKKVRIIYIMENYRAGCGGTMHHATVLACSFPLRVRAKALTILARGLPMSGMAESEAAGKVPPSTGGEPGCPTQIIPRRADNDP